jgi:hypothetical protein
MTFLIRPSAAQPTDSGGSRRPQPSVSLGAALVLWLIVAIGVVPINFAVAQRPDVTYLLPENTVAFVRIDDTQQLLKRVSSMATFRMLRDPEIEPFVKSLYDSATEAVADMQDDLGLTLEQLQSIPLGEVCFALVAPEKGTPASITIVQVKDRQDDARKVVKHWRNRLWESGRKISSEKHGDYQLTVLTNPESPDQVTVLFEFDDMLATTTNLELAKGLLSAMEQDDLPKLVDNKSFSTIMSRCAGAANEPPQVTYFVDPMRLIHSVTSKNVALQMSVAILGRLGLDGFRGVGGSLLVGGEAFESLHHTHILTDTPRTGVLSILSPRSGDIDPEQWVPNDSATYLTLHWDLVRAYSGFVTAYEQFRGPKTWSATVLPAFRNRYGIELERDLLNALDGRVTRVTWTNDAELVSRAATMLGLKLKDSRRFPSTLQKIAAHSRQSFQRRSFDGVTYYLYTPSPAMRAGNAATRALANSYVGILGDYLLVADNELLLKRAIETKRGATSPLSEELDFKLSASRIRRLSRGTQPSMISFSRPEYGLRATYDALRSQESRERLGKLAESNKVIEALYRALSEHPLPPFHVIAKYFAFSGRLVTSDETGIHSVGFTFRRQ